MPALDEALALAMPTGEMQRLGPIHVARAEAAWLTADETGFADAATALRELTQHRLTAWLRGEMHWWLVVAGATSLPAGDLAEPFALQIAGDWAAAADLWHKVGCPYESARAKLASNDEGALRTAIATFGQLGARPAATMAMQRLRDLVPAKPHRGPSRATLIHPAGLTAREAEIFALIAAGHTNREIAERLYISPKTVEHHVTAILGKLGVNSRRDASRIAATFESPPPPHGRESA